MAWTARAIGGACLVLALGACREPAGQEAAPAPAPAAERGPGLLVAGSGAGLPLLQALAAAWSREDGGRRIRVAPSIGTTGAIAALRDGAIDVGVASRPLRDDERAGLREIPLARAALVFASSGRDARELDPEELADLVLGGPLALDGCEPIVPIVREPGDSGNRLLLEVDPPLGRAVERAAREGRSLVCYTDQEMLDALHEIEGAVGYADLGSILARGGRLRILPFRHVRASRASLLDGRYPLARTLGLLVRDGPEPERDLFLGFLSTEAAARILAELEYAPPGGAR